MLAAILEKLAFGGTASVLFLQGRLGSLVFGFGLVDLVEFLPSMSTTPLAARRAR